MKIETRKQLKDLIDWYEELLEIPNWNKRKVITHIHHHYTTENEKEKT